MYAVDWKYFVEYSGEMVPATELERLYIESGPASWKPVAGEKPTVQQARILFQKKRAKVIRELGSTSVAALYFNREYTFAAGHQTYTFSDILYSWRASPGAADHELLGRLNVRLIGGPLDGLEIKAVTH